MGTKRRGQVGLGVLLILVSALPLNAMHPEGFLRRPAGIVDQSLQSNGTLVGQALDHDGQPVVGLAVRLHGTNGQTADTLTGAAGRFQFSVTHGGVFAVEAAGVFQYRRWWVFQTAPPAAHRGPLLIKVAPGQTNIVRGQGGQPNAGTWITPYHGTWILLGLLTGGVVLMNTNSDDAS